MRIFRDSSHLLASTDAPTDMMVGGALFNLAQRDFHDLKLKS